MYKHCSPIVSISNFKMDTKVHTNVLSFFEFIMLYIHMRYQGTFLIEASLTYTALEWFFTGMYPHVSSEPRIMCELFTTECACKGQPSSFTRVYTMLGGLWNAA